MEPSANPGQCKLFLRRRCDGGGQGGLDALGTDRHFDATHVFDHEEHRWIPRVQACSRFP